MPIVNNEEVANNKEKLSGSEKKKNVNLAGEIIGIIIINCSQ